MPEHTSHLWVHRFHEEKKENIHNTESIGQPSYTLTDETRWMILAILKCDQRFPICDIRDLLVDKPSIKVFHTTVQHILATEGCTKVCRNGYPNSWPMRINEFESTQPGNFWRSTLVIWRWFCVSSQIMNYGFFTSALLWKKTFKFGIKKASQSQKMSSRPFDKKILYALFWDCRGDYLSISKKGGNKARKNSKKYMVILEVLKKIKRKCPSLLSSGAILQHDNDTPHQSKTTMARIVAFGGYFFLYPADSHQYGAIRLPSLSKTKAIFGRPMVWNWGRIESNLVEMVPDKGSSFMWMEWTNSFCVTKNVSIGTAIMWKIKIIVLYL